MSLYQKPGNPTWYINISHGDERIRRSTGTADKKEAQRIHDELKAELWKQHSRPLGKTWRDACIAWLNSAERSESDRFSLRALDYKDRPLHEVTVDSFEQILQDKSAATFNRITTMINAILHMAKARGWMDRTLTVPKRAEKVKGYRFLSAEEWGRLYAALPDHLKAPARFSVATGLRQANTFGLQWNKVDLQRRMVWVEPEDAKGRKPIGIPLSDDAVAVLRGQIGQDATWVFPYKGKGRAAGKPIKDVKNAFQNACHRAGVGIVKQWLDNDGKKHREYSGFRWHDFRHTFASWHVMSGTPLEVLQKLGGWRDLRMVQRYAHLAPNYIAGFANNAKPWSQLEAMVG